MRELAVTHPYGDKEPIPLKHMSRPSACMRDPCLDGLEVLVELVYAPVNVRYDRAMRSRSNA